MHNERDDGLEEHQHTCEPVQINRYAVSVLNNVSGHFVHINHCDTGRVDAFWERRCRMEFIRALIPTVVQNQSR